MKRTIFSLLVLCCINTSVYAQTVPIIVLDEYYSKPGYTDTYYAATSENSRTQQAALDLYYNYSSSNPYVPNSYFSYFNIPTWDGTCWNGSFMTPSFIEFALSICIDGTSILNNSNLILGTWDIFFYNDSDGDDIADDWDVCPNNQINVDQDDDGICDDLDNCPNDYNPDQADYDDDGAGNVCDETLIELASFAATPKSRAVVIEWETSAEIDNAGFNIYRATDKDGDYEQINYSLMPAKGSPTEGASYEFIDTDVKNRVKYSYKLVDVDMNGITTSHGPVRAIPRLLHGLK